MRRLLHSQPCSAHTTSSALNMSNPDMHPSAPCLRRRSSLSAVFLASLGLYHDEDEETPQWSPTTTQDHIFGRARGRARSLSPQEHAVHPPYGYGGFANACALSLSTGMCRVPPAHSVRGRREIVITGPPTLMDSTPQQYVVFPPHSGRGRREIVE